MNIQPINFFLRNVVPLSIVIGVLFCGEQSNAQLSAPQSAEESATFNDAFIAEFGKLKMGNARNGIDRVLKTKFVWCLLDAGQFDEAHKAMKNLMLWGATVPASFVEPYCYSMALAGRADQIEKNVQCFKDSITVKRRLRDEECDFEFLCEVPTRHGTAVKHVLAGDVGLAIDELEAIKKLERFKGEYGDVVEAVAFEVYHASGPAACVEFLKTASGDSQGSFDSCRRGTAMLLTRRGKGYSFLSALLPAHLDSFVHEFSLAKNADEKKAGGRFPTN